MTGADIPRPGDPDQLLLHGPKPTLLIRFGGHARARAATSERWILTARWLRSLVWRSRWAYENAVGSWGQLNVLEPADELPTPIPRLAVEVRPTDYRRIAFLTRDGGTPLGPYIAVWPDDGRGVGLEGEVNLDGVVLAQVLRQRCFGCGRDFWVLYPDSGFPWLGEAGTGIALPTAARDAAPLPTRRACMSSTSFRGLACAGGSVTVPEHPKISQIDGVPKVPKDGGQWQQAGWYRRPAAFWATTFATVPVVLTIVLGAPGSGKSTLAGRLRSELRGCAVIDWDAFMPAAEGLVGRDVPTSRDLWMPYGRLVRAVVAALDNVPVILFGVCTPDELSDWPQACWILLDCDDAERRRRLSSRPLEVVQAAIVDAGEYRKLGLEVIDTTARPVDEVVEELTKRLPPAFPAGPAGQ